MLTRTDFFQKKKNFKLTLFKQIKLLVYEFKNFVDNRFSVDEILFTFEAFTIIKFVIFNESKFFEFDFSFIEKETNRDRFITIKLIYIINWFIDRIKLRRNLRVFRSIVKFFYRLILIIRHVFSLAIISITNVIRSTLRKRSQNQSKNRKHHVDSITFSILQLKKIYIEIFFVQYVRSIFRWNYSTFYNNCRRSNNRILHST